MEQENLIHKKRTKDLTVEERREHGKSYFIKKGYLIPMKVAEYVMYNAALMADHDANLYFPLKKDMALVTDYVLKDNGKYDHRRQEKEEKSRVNAIYPLTVVRLIAENMVKLNCCSNLWCEGSEVDLQYYLIIIDILDKPLYARLKSDTYMKMYSAILRGVNKQRMETIRELDSLCEEELLNVVRYLSIEQRRKDVMDTITLLVAKGNEYYSVFQSVHDADALGDFGIYFEMLLKNHREFLISPVSAKRFQMLIILNEQFRDTHGIPKDYIPADPLGDDDDVENIEIVKEQVQPLLEDANLQIKGYNKDQPTYSFPSTIPYKLVDGVVVREEKTARVRFNNMVKSLKRDQQVSSETIESMLAEGWRMNEKYCLVSPTDDKIILYPMNMGAFVKSERAGELVRMLRAEITEKKPVRLQQYVHGLGNNVTEDELSYAMQGRPEYASYLMGAALEETCQAKSKPGSTTRKRELKSFFSEFIIEAREKVVIKIVGKNIAQEGKLIPDKPSLYGEFIAAIKKLAMESPRFGEVEELVREVGGSALLFKNEEIPAIMEELARAEFADDEIYITAYVKQFHFYALKQISELSKNSMLNRNSVFSLALKTLDELKVDLMDTQDMSREQVSRIYHSLRVLASCKLGVSGNVMTAEDGNMSVASVGTRVANVVAGIETKRSLVIRHVEDYNSAMGTGDYRSALDSFEHFITADLKDVDFWHYVPDLTHYIIEEIDKRIMGRTPSELVNPYHFNIVYSMVLFADVLSRYFSGPKRAQAKGTDNSMKDKIRHGESANVRVEVTEQLKFLIKNVLMVKSYDPVVPSEVYSKSVQDAILFEDVREYVHDGRSLAAEIAIYFALTNASNSTKINSPLKLPKIMAKGMLQENLMKLTVMEAYSPHSCNNIIFSFGEFIRSKYLKMMSVAVIWKDISKNHFNTNNTTRDEYSWYLNTTGMPITKRVTNAMFSCSGTDRHKIVVDMHTPLVSLVVSFAEKFINGISEEVLSNSTQLKTTHQTANDLISRMLGDRCDKSVVADSGKSSITNVRL